jgi:hypothetical protein
MATWGVTSYYPRSYSRAYPSDANTYGVTFTGQDRFHCVLGRYNNCASGYDYSFYHGEIFYDIGTIGCGTLQAFSKYGHDWASTTINGFSVGPWTLGLQWSSSSNRWERVSQPSTAVTPC